MKREERPLKGETAGTVNFVPESKDFLRTIRPSRGMLSLAGTSVLSVTCVYTIQISQIKTQEHSRASSED